MNNVKWAFDIHIRIINYYLWLVLTFHFVRFIADNLIQSQQN